MQLEGMGGGTGFSQTLGYKGFADGVWGGGWWLSFFMGSIGPRLTNSQTQRRKN